MSVRPSSTPGGLTGCSTFATCSSTGSRCTTITARASRSRSSGPGASGDAGVEEDRDELQDIILRFPVPDITAGYRLGGKFGYAKLGAIVRWIDWNIRRSSALDLDGMVMGWGASLSAGINVGRRDVLHLQVTEGAGKRTTSRMPPSTSGRNGTPAAPSRHSSAKRFPISASSRSSTIDGASGLTTRSATHASTSTTATCKRRPRSGAGQYALANLIWTPVPNMMAGGELQWARRDNFSGDFHADDFRLQFAIRYSFAQKFGRSVR